MDFGQRTGNFFDRTFDSFGSEPMDKLSRLTTEQRANFVAYLDGELTEQDARAVEKLLAQSQVARHELEALAKTWELLDTLPRHRASPTFTERTMTAATQAELPTVDPGVSTRERLRFVVRRLAWLGSICVAGGLAFWTVRYGFPPPSEAMVRDFELIQNLERYREVDSIEFLRQLHQNKKWQESQADRR